MTSRFKFDTVGLFTHDNRSTVDFYTTEPWGQRTCYVADPDGDLIEIGSFSQENA